MKKIIILVIVALIIVIGVSLLKDNKDNKAKNDNEKIEQLKNACGEMAESSYINSLGSDEAKWYVFELEFIHQPTNELQEQLEKILGEKFETSLSNGDRLFVGFLPYRGSYRIYAGEPTEENMIYPDWNYSKLKPVE